MDVLKTSLFATALILTQAGCQLTYYARGLSEGLKILWKQRPVAEMLTDSNTPLELRRKLALAQEANSFAVQALGLNETKNYRKYVDLNRPYVSYIVQAAPEFSLEPYTWRFPFVGSVPYKGYFTLAEAEVEAKFLESQSYDTAVRGVTAFSTLGWFNDPLLSTMMDYDDFALVELVIHESVHATIYIRSQAQFNEQLATYIGQVGAREFYKFKEGRDSPTLKQMEQRTEDENTFRIFLNQEISDLKKWYQSNTGSISRKQKSERLEQIRKKYEKEIRPNLHSDRYKNLMGEQLNNAHLMAFSTYYKDLEIFERLHEALGSDPKALIQFCKNLQMSAQPHEEIKRFVSSSSSSF